MTERRKHDDAAPQPQGQARGEGSTPQDPEQAHGQSVSRMAEVGRKAARMARARRTPPTVFRHLAHMGTLGWLFVLPAVGLSAFGRFLARRLDVPQLAVGGVVLGILVGGYLVFRNLQRTLLDSEPEDR